MATIPELQDLLNAKKSVAALLTERIATNQAIKDQYASKIKFAQELGHDIGPIVLKLQSLNYTDPTILASGLEKVNYTINNIINQISMLNSVSVNSSRLGIDGTPPTELTDADDIPDYVRNRDAELAINNVDIKQDGGYVPPATNDWPTEGWA